MRIKPRQSLDHRACKFVSGRRYLHLKPMPEFPTPPNDSIAQLIDILGLEDTRDLVRTYLQEYDGIIRVLSEGNREVQHRAAHSLKSSSSLMGLESLASYLAELELRLTQSSGKVNTDDIELIAKKIAGSIQSLKVFANSE